MARSEILSARQRTSADDARYPRLPAVPSASSALMCQVRAASGMPARKVFGLFLVLLDVLAGVTFLVHHGVRDGRADEQ